MPRGDGTVRIEYDDSALDIIDKINEELAAHNLMLEDDMLEHDGWMILTLKEKK